MEGKKLTLAITLTLGLTTMLNGSFVHAASVSELNKQQKELEQKKSSVISELNEASQKLEENKSNQAALSADMQKLDAEIQEATQKLDEINQQINQKNQEITNLENEIKQIEERIKKRDQLLKERARAMQANGTVNYLDVLLGSQSFTDFISRVTAVSTIMEADKSIIEEHKRDHKLLNENKLKIEQEKAQIETLKGQLESTKATLETKKAEKDQILAKLKEEQDSLEEHYMDLQEQQQLYANQEAAIKKAIELEQKRQAEAAKAQQREAAASGGGGSSAPAAPVTGGLFIRPTGGSITSGFGGRGSGHHFGIDIGGSAGDPVYAAASGVVYRSYYSSSYGNVVFITHYINGQTYDTIYAHLSSRSVNEGDVVQQGQYIGAKGTTGQSTGVHLHFELHVGKWNVAKSNAVDPRSYIHF
ncbi:peptidoglycan DD-metalloendopeptidase family protein [Caldifermentibacillus hisashii]|uniref:murein hydrolase activator EnvC family protein n=1 Tax=Caldifermentibacillus hisashii TaxID=996558 RepID=UPI0031FD444C